MPMNEDSKRRAERFSSSIRPFRPNVPVCLRSLGMSLRGDDDAVN